LGSASLLIALAALLAASVIYAVRLAGDRPPAEPSANRQVLPLTPPPPAAPALDKSLLAEILGPGELAAVESGFLALEGPDGRGLFARTTLDYELQAKALQWISQIGGVRAAMVAIDPMSGRVLALAGTSVDGRNSALSGTYPAASVFKIITAAAAVEKAGLSGASVVQYDGAKHTLYKSNVVKPVDKGIHKATLRSSFAESLNSVFGKLGAHEIGGQGLLSFANRFGFNRRLNFEMPLEASVFDLGAAGPADPGIPAGDGGEAEDAYSMALAAQNPRKVSGLGGGAQAQNLKTQASFGPASQNQPSQEEAPKDPAEEIFHLAELASGFNRVTKISPVHGALMAAAAINGGILYEPTVISEVFDKQNEILYQSFPAPAGLVLGEEAASELRGMMTAAVHEGTGRKQFSDALDHRILSKLELGGKSGSINDEEGSIVDWFVAFARPFEEASSAPPIALAAVVVHQGNARLTSQELIRRALLIYYGGRLKSDAASQDGAPNGAQKL
jgi:cell division protein FtsI/penicillin-binding protein 2